MKRLILSIIILISISGGAISQDISGFIAHVAGNDPEIRAYRKLLEARKIEAMTGITPSDPVVSAGYMPGYGPSTGVKRTFSVTQSFSFPVKYLTQINSGRRKGEMAEQEFNLILISKLNEARMTMFDLIYHRKMIAGLIKRKENYDRLRSSCERMLEKGETTILDFNRVSLELSSVNLRISLVKAGITALGERLRFMSGNSIAIPENDEYPVFSDPGPELLLKEKEERHPAFLLPGAEYKVMLQEVKMSRTGSMPEFEAGYSSEVIPSESFGGVVAGISIPLWSNANRVKASKAMAEQSMAAMNAEHERLRTEFRTEYEKMNSLKGSISELTDLSRNAKSLPMLGKALSSGEISFITYFQYLETEYEVEDRLLELENQYYKTLSTLNDLELLK